MSQERERELIFVGHSYGGLIIKQVRLKSSLLHFTPTVLGSCGRGWAGR